MLDRTTISIVELFCSLHPQKSRKKMDFKTKNKLKKLLAVLSLAVFLSALLVKPLHIIIEHHDNLEITCFHHEKDMWVADHHFDCNLCEFEFCTFIAQKSFEFPSVFIFSIKEKALSAESRLVFATPSFFLLRAPPVI